MNKELRFKTAGASLPGDLALPNSAQGLIVFAHGSGSSRKSPRNRFVAETLRASGRFGTLLFDLLTPDEDADYANRFDIALLAGRLESVTLDVLSQPNLGDLPLGYFGASTGAAAAIAAAVRLGERIKTVVSRGGRPDLAGPALRELFAPTLLIVGGLDDVVIGLNQQALAMIPAAAKCLEIVPGATHLFEEPGTLERAAELTLGWFERFLV